MLAALAISYHTLLNYAFLFVFWIEEGERKGTRQREERIPNL